eukprot:scaffold88144_cov71-Cyclotella_meneghiniana.AAC.3
MVMLTNKSTLSSIISLLNSKQQYFKTLTNDNKENLLFCTYADVSNKQQRVPKSGVIHVVEAAQLPLNKLAWYSVLRFFALVSKRIGHHFHRSLQTSISERHVASA